MKNSDACTPRNIIHDICAPKSVITWILTNIKHPIKGYEHKTAPCGCYMNAAEQLSETHYQLMVIASDFYRRGATESRILKILQTFKSSEY